MRVVVCGSHYGATYVHALSREPGLGTLAALLARGSRRSQQLASKLGVPLCREVDELPDGTDLALVALGSHAASVVDDLLARGIHALCEHPVSAERIVEMDRLAVSNRVRAHVNAHFPSLPAVRCFIRAFRRMRRESHARQIAVTCSDRALYAVAAILLEATISESVSWQLGSVVVGQPYTVTVGSFGQSQLVLEVQRTDTGDGLADGSPDILLDFRIRVVLRTGVLSLLSPAGPVVWTANGNRVANASSELWRLLAASSPVTAEQLFNQRIDANCRSIEALQRDIETGDVPQNQTVEHLLRVSRLWEEAAQAFSTGTAL